MKLPVKRLEELRRLCPNDKVPGWPDPDSDAVCEIEDAIQESLEAERSRKGLKKMSPPRRAFFGISTLNAYFKGDGLTTGVAINDPELLLVAIEGAKVMKLSGPAKILTKAKRWFPPENTWKSIRKREAWFESVAGQEAAEKLDELEEELSNSEAEPGFSSSCLLYALANPSEFFQ